LAAADRGAAAVSADSYVNLQRANIRGQCGDALPVRGNGGGRVRVFLGECDDVEEIPTPFCRSPKRLLCRTAARRGFAPSTRTIQCPGI